MLEPIFKVETPEYKSKLILGNTTIYLTKKLNWFQRKMYKIFFNIIAENITAENIKEEK